MAESTSKLTEQGKDAGCKLECAVCLQSCIHPAQLPCGHIFCYLCCKGIANQSKRCAMCRQEIPRDFLEHPKLLDNLDVKDSPEEFEGGYQWFYEGRNGWWKYDERSNEDLEAAFKLNLEAVEILICGELYVIDIVQMLQYPKRQPSRIRFIKRDKQNIPVKGIAGWWQYDERTSRELESFYKAGERTCELLIAGFLYVADFDSMVQRRRNDPARKRRIKRDLSSIPKKGIAGIKLVDDQTTSVERSDSPSSNCVCPTPPVTPADMPQTPVERIPGEDTVLDHESLQSTIEQMQSLTLRSDNTASDDSDDNESSSSNLYVFSRGYLDSYRNSK